MKQRYLLQLSYLGTAYHGWQRQPQVPTVQATIEEHLRQLDSEVVHLHGCGRTDKGVHASNYIAHADLSPHIVDGIDPDLYGIQIHKIVPVEAGFHAQLDALNRTYCYLAALPGNHHSQNLIGRFFQEFDLDLLIYCAHQLEGIHDFGGLCRTPDKFPMTKCRVDHAQWDSLSDGQVLRFRITANRFLPQMVRIVVAAMMEVASGRLGIRQWESLLEARSCWGSRAAAYSNGLYFLGASFPEIALENYISPILFHSVKEFLQ